VDSANSSILFPSGDFISTGTQTSTLLNEIVSTTDTTLWALEGLERFIYIFPIFYYYFLLGK
jgi:hypothetical protein